MRLFRFFLGVLFVFFAYKAVAGEKELNVYNWGDYFGETTLSDFEKEYGIKVNLQIFEDEEEMISELQSHPEKHDIVIASDETVRELINMRLLAEMNLVNIPNTKNIEERFKNPSYDPRHKHSIPYLWGTTGIAINRNFVNENVDSWSILWDPKYKSKIAMLNNPDEVIGAALKYLGYSVNTNDSTQLESARHKLLEQKSLGVVYLGPVEIRSRLISNELWAAQIYSGEGMYAVDKNDAIKYFVPKEGSSLWVDCLCIPRDAEQKYTAEVFINYILSPIVSAKIVNYLWYANCNIAAQPYTNKEILTNISLYPSALVLERCEFFKKTGTEEERNKTQQIHNKIWSELQLGEE